MRCLSICNSGEDTTRTHHNSPAIPGATAGKRRQYSHEIHLPRKQSPPAIVDYEGCHNSMGFPSGSCRRAKRPTPGKDSGSLT